MGHVQLCTNSVGRTPAWRRNNTIVRSNVRIVLPTVRTWARRRNNTTVRSNFRIVPPTVRTIDDPCGRTSNIERYKNKQRFPNSARRATHDFPFFFASEQYRKSSGTSESSSRTFVNTLGALTNILGTFYTQTIWNTDLLRSLQHIIVNIAFVPPYVNHNFNRKTYISDNSRLGALWRSTLSFSLHSITFLCHGL